MAKVSVKWARGGAYHGQLLKTPLVTPGTMLEAGTWLATKVEHRAQSGKDEAGNKFTPYSEAYAKEKNVARNAVDLTRSGDMWRSWGVLWASARRVRIGFRSARMAQRARYNIEMGRPFLGIERRWLTELRTRLAKRIGFHRL